MLNSLKKITLIVFSLFVLFSSISFADNEVLKPVDTDNEVTGFDNKASLTEEKIRKEFKKLGVEVVSIEKKDSNRAEMGKELKLLFKKNEERKPIKINSLEEIEQIVNELKQFNISEDEYLEESQSFSILPELDKVSSSDIKEGNATVSSWAPLFGAFAWKNISFNFTYSYYPLAGYYIIESIPSNRITSHLSGLTVLLDWNQTSASANKTDASRKAELKVTGYYVLGFDFEGYEIGARVNGSWNMTSKNINDYVN